MLNRSRALLVSAALVLTPIGARAASTNFVSPVQSFSCSSQVTTALTQGTGVFTCSNVTAAMFGSSITAGTVFGNNSGSAGAPAFTAAPVLGVASTTSGSLGIYSSASANAVTIQQEGATSAYNFNLPSTAGSAGQAMVSEGGGSSAMQWASVVTAKFTTVSKTTSYQIATGTDDWTRFDNAGASGSVTLTLPTAANTSAGDNWCMEVVAADTFEMLGNTGQTFTVGNTTGASAGNIQANTAGSSWCVYAQTDDNIVVYSSNGAIQVN